MQISDHIMEYHDADCIFWYNPKTRVLRVHGTSVTARTTILRLRKERWLPKNLHAIWFDGDPIHLIVGISLTLYLVSVPPKPKRPLRSFRDIVTRS